MDINLKNIEEIIFFDKKLQSLMPEFRHFFDQWALGQRLPGMKSLAQRTVFDLINSLNESHVELLQNYFNEPILIDKIDHKLVANFETDLDKKEQDLCKFVGYKEFSIYRNKDKVSVTFWR